MKYSDPWEAYNNDPSFHRLVDMMTALLLQAEYTPSEIRQAAIMAAIKLEHMRPTPSIFIRAHEPPQIIRRRY